MIRMFPADVVTRYARQLLAADIVQVVGDWNGGSAVVHSVLISARAVRGEKHGKERKGAAHVVLR